MKRPPRLSTPWGRLTEAARQVPTPHVEVPFGFSARVAALSTRLYAFGNELQGRLQRRLPVATGVAQAA